MDKKNKHISLRDCKLLSHTGTIMDNRYIRLFIAAYLLPLFMLLTGCVSELVDAKVDYYGESATLYLTLDIPGINSAQKNGNSYSHNSGYDSERGYESGQNPGYGVESRAMSAANESYIDYSNIYALVFEEVGQDEVFRYQATITALAPPQITLKVSTSKAQERFRLVVIANATVPYIAYGTPKNEALNQFVFNCAGKWNTSDESFSLIPMWGEYSRTFAIKNNMSVNMLMHRALARVDVGALFKFNNSDPISGQDYADRDTDKESVWGLNNFKIKNIRVYRTLNKAYVASSADKMVKDEVTTPNAPASAKYNSDSGIGIDDLGIADNHPLVYTLPVGSNSYIREIYIPESFPLDGNSFSGNVPCLVIGGYYGENNNTLVTYYRADFASYNNGKISAYLPLLRNHRYVFDIRSVGGPGYNEPEQALNFFNSDLILDMQEWNEVPLNHYVHGSYFFSIDTREVTLDARPKGGATDVSYAISYRTNLDLDPVSNPFTYKWESSGSIYNDDFDVIFDYSAKTITVAAKYDNVGFGVKSLSDQLCINVENYQFTIDVEQTAINADYTPDCYSIDVSGEYRINFALNHTNYISIKITSDTTLIGLNYDVRTVVTNGVYFAAKGIFDTDGTYINGAYEYNMQLKGYGTLKNQSGFFNVIINFDKIIPANCFTGIMVSNQ